MQTTSIPIVHGLSWRRQAAAAALMVLTCAGGVQAQAGAYPNKPVRLIVPFAAGGATDVLARVIGVEMAKTLGQPVVVDNKVGAAGNIGTDFVAKSAPDGYTVCFCTTGPQTLAPHLMKLPFDPVKDLVPVVHIHNLPNIILARHDFPASNIQELVALARQKPGKITFGTPGQGGPQHMTGELLNSMAGIKLNHVPYKGETPAFTDLAGGQIDLAIGSISVSEALIKAGKIKALAVTGTKRSAAMPAVPTVVEAGYPGFEAFTLVGLNVPAGTPADVILKLNQSVNAALGQPAVSSKMVSMVVEPVGGTPEAYAGFLRKEFDKWGRIVREAKITVE